jgi:hypothetical protein
MFGSSTAWFPVVDPTPSISRDVLTASQVHVHGVVSVVQNLTTPQMASFFSQTSPFTFFPHVGLFVSEFAAGSALGK